MRGPTLSTRLPHVAYAGCQHRHSPPFQQCNLSAYAVYVSSHQALCSLFAGACRANAVFAVLAFVQSVLWLSQIADEVVALFQVCSPALCT